jgi:hypothetical protein
MKQLKILSAVVLSGALVMQNNVKMVVVPVR